MDVDFDFRAVGLLETTPFAYISLKLAAKAARYNGFPYTM